MIFPKLYSIYLRGTIRDCSLKFNSGPRSSWLRVYRLSGLRDQYMENETTII